jgi:hypothetical protein
MPFTPSNVRFRKRTSLGCSVLLLSRGAIPSRVEICHRLLAACCVTTIRQRWDATAGGDHPEPPPILWRLPVHHDPPDDSIAVVHVVIIVRPVAATETPMRIDTSCLRKMFGKFALCSCVSRPFSCLCRSSAALRSADPVARQIRDGDQSKDGQSNRPHRTATLIARRRGD